MLEDPDEFPIAPPARFGLAMSYIACKAESRAQVILNSAFKGGTNKEVNEQLTWALVQIFNLGSTQQENMVLKNMVEKQGSTADLKQALKVRAAVYGSQVWCSHHRELI